jgi:hypothetical protein
VAGRYAQAARGTADANVLDGLHQIAEASKVRERAPDIWHSYLQQVTQEHGAPKSVYVSPEAFAQTFSTPEGRVALGNMPDAVRDAVQVSAATGGDVKIPTADFGTYVAGTPLYEQLADHVKFDPNSYTRAQAEEIMKTEGPRVLAEMDSAVKQKAATDEFAAGRDRVEAQIRDQIGATSRYSPEVAAINAKLGAHSVAAMAARTGLTPESFHAAHGFTVGDGEARTAGQALEQGSAVTREDARGAEPAAPPTRDLRPKGLGKRASEGAARNGLGDAGSPANRRLAQERLPIAKLTGDEIAPSATPLKGLRKAVGQWYESNLRGTSVSSDALDGRDVTFASSRKSLSNGANPVKLQAFHALKDVIAHGELMESVPPKDPALEPNTKAYHYIRGPIEVGGKAYDIGVMIREDNNGHLYYNHRADESAAQAPETFANERGPGDADDAYEQRVQHDGDNLNLTLRQGEARGQYMPEVNTINLLKDANLSTFIHELGHYNLETLNKFADAHPDIRSDFETLLKWFDPDLTIEKWRALGFEEMRPHHEKFAEGTEKYLFEGKAPTRELRPIFQRMAAWLKNVYRSIKGLGVELTPEVRGVMDRLVAAPDAIREAQADVGLAPILTERPAAMTDDQWASYQRQILESQIGASEALGMRSIRDMRWLEGAKSVELKRLQEEHKTLRATARDEVTAQVMQEPVERAREFLRFGRIDGEQVVFVRPGELQCAEWSEFDFAKHIRTIPAAKTKMRRPLPVRTLSFPERTLPHSPHHRQHTQRRHATYGVWQG